MKELLLKPFRAFTEQYYNELGIKKSGIQLNPHQPTGELKLSTRLKSVLLKNNINNVTDISNISNMDILDMIGLGNKLITELERFRYQYQLGQYYND